MFSIKLKLRVIIQLKTCFPLNWRQKIEHQFSTRLEINYLCIIFHWIGKKRIIEQPTLHSTKKLSYFILFYLKRWDVNAETWNMWVQWLFGVFASNRASSLLVALLRLSQVWCTIPYSLLQILSRIFAAAPQILKIM